MFNLENNSKTIYKLSIETGIPVKTLYEMQKKDLNIRISTAAKLIKQYRKEGMKDTEIVNMLIKEGEKFIWEMT